MLQQCLIVHLLKGQLHGLLGHVLLLLGLIGSAGVSTILGLLVLCNKAAHVIRLLLLHLLLNLLLGIHLAHIYWLRLLLVRLELLLLL